MKFGYTANSRNVTTGYFVENVPQVFAKFIESFSLGHIVGVILQVSEPRVILFPVNVSNRFHAYIIPRLTR